MGHSSHVAGSGSVTDTMPRRAPARRRMSAYIPPQHGAWAFLVVPLLVGFAQAGWAGVGLLFSLAWIAAYPVSYFGGRALTARVRRGCWTRLARREAGRAVPWLVAVAGFGLPLLWAAPWLAAVAGALGLAWLASLALAARYGDRSLVNDAVLVGQAVCAVPLLWLVVATVAGLPGVAPGTPVVAALEAAPASLRSATLAVGWLLFGSVLAVRSQLRGAGDVRLRWASIAMHAVGAVVWGLADPRWLLGFGPALVRAVVVRPGLRPPVIGAVETVVSACFVAAAFWVEGLL